MQNIQVICQSLPIGSQGWLYATTVGRVKLQSMVFKDYLADTERDVRNCSPYKKQAYKERKERKKNGIRN
jgi:hypothetical protein|uniref:Uncharacterized protein n=1 Tax=Populus trichocarpa TaxID=3694 RepID=A0A2K2BEG3_POPTR